MIETVYTIGHSNYKIEQFIGLLEAHGITAVSDVRSRPYSYRPAAHAGAWSAKDPGGRR